MTKKEFYSIIMHPETLVVANNSGGKDSQNLYLELREMDLGDRLVVIHAHLPEVEWEGSIDFIKSTIDHELFVVQAKKTFFDLVKRRYELNPERPCFPSPNLRQCTSDLKRAPIAKQIRKLSNERGYKTVINAMGMRAQESSCRAKKPILKTNKKETNGKRRIIDWLPIHHKTEAQVFDEIKAKGQKPFWVYKEGMTRKSCKYCIMSSRCDLKTAAKLNPDGILLDKIDDFEIKTGHTMIMPTKKQGKRTLKEIINS
tara:strand:- start:336 stop:1106 length:771 start_codon:yes stop_codon:yes gene_type:complete